MLESEIQSRVRDASHPFFERVIVDLMVAMGYGDGDASKSRLTGRSGDRGIDGAIKEDTVGLNEVYVQTKKYTEGGNFGVGDFRNIGGAIDTAGTSKGVCVSTAELTRSAWDYVARNTKRVVPTDTEELTQPMIQRGVRIRTRVRHEIERVDEDYFDQEAL